ncbi:MAG: hypothetical protein IT427_00475 [Pirellulales bacterium]|nr:hypothetical protein [Pirellulales bacterium]
MYYTRLDCREFQREWCGYACDKPTTTEYILVVAARENPHKPRDIDGNPERWRPAREI